jgi:ABC-type tungstate transport system substrate-binding protein
VIKLLTLSSPFDVIFTLDVTIVLEEVIVALPLMVTRELNTVLEGTAPKKFFTVIFFDVGTPFGSSITSSRSSEAVAPKDDS